MLFIDIDAFTGQVSKLQEFIFLPMVMTYAYPRLRKAKGDVGLLPTNSVEVIIEKSKRR